MTATLWIDTDAEETVELGGAVELYAAYSEWARLAGRGFYGDWPSLSGLVTQVESQEDADPDWLVDCRREAGGFLARYGEDLGEHSRWVLRRLASG